VRLYAAVIYLFLYIPIGIIVLFSFNAGRHASELRGFSIKWYGNALSNPFVMDALMTSLTVAFCTAVLASLFGSIAALALQRVRGRLRMVFDAMTLADRIVLLKDGVIEQQGTPLELFERPATRFVAGFLGSPAMNFIPARLEAKGGALEVVFSDGKRLAMPASRSDALSQEAGREIVFGVRPEHIERARDGVGRSGQVPLEATIDLVQPTGSRTYGTFLLGAVEVVAELEVHGG